MMAYVITTFAVMVAVPPRNQGSLAGIAEAVQMGFGPAGTVLSAIVDALLIGYFVFVGAVYNSSYARLLFVSGLDRRLPAIISKVNSKRVPWCIPTKGDRKCGTIKGMRTPIFIRPFTEDEQHQIQAGLRSSNAFVMRRCQILRASARGERAPEIARQLGCDHQTVPNAIHEFNPTGLTGLHKGS